MPTKPMALVMVMANAKKLWNVACIVPGLARCPSSIALNYRTRLILPTWTVSLSW